MEVSAALSSVAVVIVLVVLAAACAKKARKRPGQGQKDVGQAYVERKTKNPELSRLFPAAKFDAAVARLENAPAGIVAGVVRTATESRDKLDEFEAQLHKDISRRSYQDELGYFLGDFRAKDSASLAQFRAVQRDTAPGMVAATARAVEWAFTDAGVEAGAAALVAELPSINAPGLVQNLGDDHAKLASKDSFESFTVAPEDGVLAAAAALIEGGIAEDPAAHVDDPIMMTNPNDFNYGGWGGGWGECICSTTKYPGRPFFALHVLYAMCLLQSAAFHADVGALFVGIPGLRVLHAAMKKWARSDGKLKDKSEDGYASLEPGAACHLKDVLRLSVVCDSIAGMRTAHAALAAAHTILSRKQRLLESTHDVLVIIRLNGLLQFHLLVHFVFVSVVFNLLCIYSN